MYKLPEQFDGMHMPITLGSPLRVPHYAWTNWGIRWESEDDFRTLVELSEKEYRKEWEFKTTACHNNINQAAKDAGLSEANDTLNQSVSGIVGDLVKRTHEKTRILDLGAGVGATTLSILDKLSRMPEKKIELILLEPSTDALESAKSRLNAYESDSNIMFRFINTPDLELLNYVEKSSIDIVVTVASIHHHAYLERPFKLVREILRKNGYFISADWHNSMWEHPGSVYQMLSRMDWEGKESDLKRFTEFYPSASSDFQQNSNPLDKEANKQIINFWRSYSRLSKGQMSQFLVLEGHRPVSRYIDLMKKVGFSIYKKPKSKILPENPWYLLPGSSLLVVLLGRIE